MMREQGRLIEWFDEKGYGFIQPLDAKKQKVFLHIKDFAKRGPRPILGCALEYVVMVDSQGRFRAKQITYLKANEVSKKTYHLPKNLYSSQNSNLGFMNILIIIFAIGLMVLTTFFSQMNYVFTFIIIMNVITYTLYKKDKNAALDMVWRVPEQTLHLVALLGGWPAAYYAQNKYRHKTQKKAFQTIYKCTIILNIILILILITQLK